MTPTMIKWPTWLKYYEEVLPKKNHGRLTITKPSYDFKKSPFYRYFIYLIEVITR